MIEQKYVQINLKIRQVDYGMSVTTLIQPLEVTGVHKTILCGADWIKLREADLK